jgi:hypothetical protein
MLNRRLTDEVVNGEAVVDEEEVGVNEVDMVDIAVDNLVAAMIVEVGDDVVDAVVSEACVVEELLLLDEGVDWMLLDELEVVVAVVPAVVEVDANEVSVPAMVLELEVELVVVHKHPL